MSNTLVVILMGSKADEEHCRRIAEAAHALGLLDRGIDVVGLRLPVIDRNVRILLRWRQFERGRCAKLGDINGAVNQRGNVIQRGGGGEAKPAVLHYPESDQHTAIGLQLLQAVGLEDDRGVIH